MAIERLHEDDIPIGFTASGFPRFFRYVASHVIKKIAPYFPDQGKAFVEIQYHIDEDGIWHIDGAIPRTNEEMADALAIPVHIDREFTEAIRVQPQ